MTDTNQPRQAAARAIATWSFSGSAVMEAGNALTGNSDALSAVCAGIRCAELDTEITSVGYGGLPNTNGTLELDAAITGGDGRAGAVAGLQGYRCAVKIAMDVLHQSPHTLLVGQGAQDFALKCENVPEPNEDLLTPHARRRLNEFRTRTLAADEPADTEASMHTDTIGLICRDEDGRIAAGCATSGMEFKQPGRVGDAPILGAGLFADDDVGAAVASGDGDAMMRFSISALVVEEMRRGATPREACVSIMNRVRLKAPTCQAAVCAMHAKTGETGAACTRDGFKVVEWDPNENEGGVVIRVVPGPDGEIAWKHTCV